MFCNLYITWTLKTPPALYSMEYLNMQHECNVCVVLTVGILWRTSGQCGHHTTGLSGLDVHHWSVWVNVHHLVIHKQHNVQYDQWHWAAAVLKFRWNFLCSVAIYTESDESSWHATATISKVCFNIIHLIYDHIHMPFRFSDKNFVGNFHFSKMSHIQHKTHSPKTQCNFLHPPVIFSILPPNISLITTFLNSSLQLNRQLHLKTTHKNICWTNTAVQ